jgi:hypothetical protein
VLDGYLVYTFILYYYTQRDGKHQITRHSDVTLVTVHIAYDAGNHEPKILRMRRNQIVRVDMNAP